MSEAVPNKVDMSLDDIIKISKLEKKKQARAAKKQARGGGLARGRGGTRGQGRGGNAGRGRGAAVRQALNRAKQLRKNIRGGKRGRGVGRGGGAGGGGEGGSNSQQTSGGVSPLKRNQQYGQNQRGNLRGRGGRGRGGRGRGQGRGGGRGQGRGRGQGGGIQGKQIVFTNSYFKQQGGQQALTAEQLQRQRLNKARQQATLLREKQLALKNLQQAQKNMQTVNLALQKTSRENVVNQMRGVNFNQNQGGQGGGRGRGRGRGRKLLTSLMRSTGNDLSPTRQLTHTSVTISNPSAFNTNSNSSPGQGQKRRRWRRNRNNPQLSSEHFTIHVANQNLQPNRNEQSSVIMEQLKNLKPAVATTYKFQKNVFAAPATGVSLNDRFSSSRSSLSDGGDGSLEGRKVFL